MPPKAKEEIYDIFDKKGKKIGTATWTQVHKKGLLHQVADILIFKDKTKKEILLQKRSLKMAHDPGLWCAAAGGHIKSGQTPRQAIKEEIKEELFSNNKIPNLKITKIVTYQTHDLPENYEISHIFEAICPGPFFPGKEVIKTKWVKWDWFLKDLKKNPQKYTQFFHKMIKEYLKK